MNLARWTKAVRAEHQIRGREAFIDSEIGTIFKSSGLKAGNRFFESLFGAAIPEMPSLSDQIFGFRNIQSITDFGPMRDPRTEFLQYLLYLSNSDVHGMPRHDNSVPGFRNHLLIVDVLSAILNESFEYTAGLTPQCKFDAFSQHSSCRHID